MLTFFNILFSFILFYFFHPRFDLVGVSRGGTNDSLVVEVMGRGQTVLHLWDHNLPTLHDYLRLNAGPAITPDRVSEVNRLTD